MGKTATGPRSVSKAQIVVERRCRHGELHPHSHYRRDNVDVVMVAEWCTEGDVWRPESGPPFELRDLISEVLMHQHPRLPKDDVSAKTTQIIDAMHDKVREGRVIRR